jgi:CBS domain-containing protein
LSCEYQTDPLEILFVREVMDAAVRIIPSRTTHREIIDALDERRGRQSLFAVIDENDALLGVVTRWMLEQWAVDAQAPPLASIARPAITAQANEPLRAVMNRMAETGRTELPVVDDANPAKLLGTITLRHMLKARVRHLEEERRREVVLPLHLMLPGWLRAAPRKT